MDKLTITLLVLTATWGAMYNVIQVSVIVNNKRDLVLDIDEDGERLDKTQKQLLLYSDYIPIWLGIVIFLVIYAGAFAYLPTILDNKVAALAQAKRQRNQQLTVEEELMRPSALERRGCYAAALFGGFALLVQVIGGPCEICKMRAHLDKMTQRVAPTTTPSVTASL